MRRGSTIDWSVGVLLRSEPLRQSGWAARFWRDEGGPTAVEYAVMLALIVVACIGTIAALGGSGLGLFDSNFTKIQSAFGGGP